jgi:transposase InsO family protein
MAWRVVNVMSLRLEFVTLAAQPGAKLSELCRRFGVSRQTGYKWLARFGEAGEAGLVDRSRRPHGSPSRTDAAVEEAVLAVRRANRCWGGRKIRRVLLNARPEGLPAEQVPAASTITGILRRHGLLERDEPAPQPFKRFEAVAPNRLWQMDFKGHFALDGRTDGGGVRCWPLTVLDDHSRYAIGAEACTDEKEVTVCERLTKVFERHGLPDAIITDNGAPWGHQNGVTKYTRFSVWLLRLGVKPLHSRPRHPQTMGKIERLHRSLRAELLQGRRFADLDAVQSGLDRWRARYNHQRPHDALGGAFPASRYRMSERSMPARLVEPDYPDDQVTGRVRRNGCLRCRPQDQRRVDLQLSAAFADQRVAVRPSAEDGVHHVWFMTWRIAKVDFRTNPERPTVTHVLERM